LSDFAQTGLICTLQRLNDAHLPQLEAELVELASDRPIALVLPCHRRDLAQPALGHLVQEIAGAAFLAEIIISINGVERGAEDAARERFATLPQPLTFLWNDREQPAGTRTGKGENVAAAVRYLSKGGCEIVVFQDCDVVSFRRANLARLCYAVANPELGYRFAKAYYSRATDRLYGRVSRLFLAPLLHALVRVAGHQPLIGFLLSFRYPLAGEVAMTSELARSLPMMNGWGLELGQLCEVFRRVDPRECCQVDGGSGYDHKHQPATPALTEMAAEIARELFRQAALEGIGDTPAFHLAVREAYRREGEFALHRSASLALINGLPFDCVAESALVEMFAQQLAALD
jgi:glucosyl-3-phosphoglycerate synthase